MNSRQVLLNKIREYGPISKRELQDVSGLSWAMISRVVNQLVEKGYLEENCRETDRVGRKAEEYDISGRNNYFIGIDLNYSGIFFVLTDLKARVIWSREIELIPEERERERVISYLYQGIDELFLKYHDRRICGIGIAVQGPARRQEGISVNIGRIRGWKEVPLKALLEERYHVEVQVEHDPDALMRSEMTFCTLDRQEASEAVLVSLNHRIGIGMSLLIHDKLYYGSDGYAGDIGGFVVNGEIEGPRRRLDNYVLKEHIVYDYSVLKNNIGELTYQEIAEKAKAGDPLCRGIFEDLGKKIGMALASICCVLNPKVVIFFAAQCECAEIIFEKIRDTVLENTWNGKPELKLSSLGGEAVVLGAVLIAIERFIKEI